MRKGDFSPATIKLLSERAGHECSVPYCSVRTVGPGASETQIAKVGQASHIYSASMNGPRGQGGKTPEQLADVSNGIWTCELHGKAIDNNEGNAFPAGLLKSWKTLHEARVRRASTGSPVQHWVERIDIKRSPLFQSSSIAHLGRVTVVAGDNGSGKTAICEWLSGLRESKPLERWTKKNALYALNLELSYVSDKDHVLGLSIPAGKGPSFFLDGILQPIPPNVIDVVYLPQRYLNPNRGDDLHGVAELFAITPEMAIDVAGSVGANGNKRFREIVFEPRQPDEDEPVESVLHEDGTPHMQMIVETYSPNQRFALASFGGGVHTEVLLAMAAELARFKSKHRPTLLIIEGGDWGFARTSFVQVADAIDHCARDFQVLLVEPSNGLDDGLVESREWVRYKLIDRDRKGSSLRQLATIEPA